MSVLNVNDCLAILDSVAVAVQRLKEKFGTGVEDGSASKACKTNYDRIKDLSYFIDYHSDLKRLLDGANASFNYVLDKNIYVFFQDLLSNIWRLQGGLNTFLSNNDARIAEEVAKLYWDSDNETGLGQGYAISPENVLPPAIENMGVFDYDSGFTDGDAIDTSKYGKAFIKVKTTVGIGSGNDLVLTVTVKKIDGTTEEKTVTIPAGTSADTEFDVGDGVNDMYVDVVDCTASSGNSGDAVQFYSVYERALNE